MVLLYGAGVTQTVHLPPVRLKGLLPLRHWVQQVLDEVVKRRTQPRSKRLFHCLWWVGLVAVTTQNAPAKVVVEVLFGPEKLVPVGGDETDKRVPDKHELGVVLELGLQDTTSRCLLVTCHTDQVGPVRHCTHLHLWPGEAVQKSQLVGQVDQVHGDRHGVWIRLAPVENKHHPLPVGTSHLKNKSQCVQRKASIEINAMNMTQI